MQPAPTRHPGRTAQNTPGHADAARNRARISFTGNLPGQTVEKDGALLRKGIHAFSASDPESLPP